MRRRTTSDSHITVMFPFEGKVCGDCASCFNLDEIFTSSPEDRRLWYGPSNPVWENSKCPLCKLFWLMRPSEKWSAKDGEDPIYEIRSYQNSARWDETHNSRFQRKYPNCFAALIGIRSSNLSLIQSSGRYQDDGTLRDKGYISCISSNSQMVGGLFSPHSIDFDILKGWISYCEERHTETCGAKDYASLPYLYVIDCASMRVIRLNGPVQDRYIALSYVWGKPAKKSSDSDNDKPSFSSGRLPNNLPNTIKDAITVIKKLDCRYLWVAPLCI
jgi:hypothetical protein